jgi:hypothetical protein
MDLATKPTLRVWCLYSIDIWSMLYSNSVPCHCRKIYQKSPKLCNACNKLFLTGLSHKIIPMGGGGVQSLVLLLELFSL